MNPKSELKEMYDAAAESYSRSYFTPAGRYFMERKIQTAFRLAPFQGRVLEVGCANGPYSIEIAKRNGCNIVGLDLSPNSIEYAQKWAEQEGITARFVTGDAEHIQFQDNYFDTVFSFSCLRYLDNPQQAINEIFRVLKPSCHAVIDFPNALSPWFNLIKPRVGGGVHIHDHQYKTRDIVGYMKIAGFKDIKVVRILYTPKRAGRLLPIFKALDKIGELPVLNNFASIIMVDGEKP